MNGKILIVDDDIDTLQLIGTMLERKGFEILAAQNGLKALELAETEIPDLILLDIMMPGMDGYEVTRRIRDIDSTALIPIILFTAMGQNDDKVAGYESGADDYLVKPTHPTELISRVNAILNRNKTEALDIDRRLGTNQSGNVFGVIGTKGGLGVSTLSLNLGVSIHNLTKEFVTVAEFRPGMGDIGSYLGYSRFDGLEQLLKKSPGKIIRADVEETLITHGSGIQLLLAGLNPEDAEMGAATLQLKSVVTHLSYIAPYTIIDLGTGLSQTNQEIAKLCTSILLISEPAQNTLGKTMRLLKSLESLGIKSETIQIILINPIQLDKSKTLSDVEDILGHPISAEIASVPELAHQAAALGVPMLILNPENIAIQQINKLSEKITNST